MVLTGKDVKVFTTAMVINCGVTIALSIGSRIILKQNEKLTKQVNDSREVGMSLGKIAVYQKTLIEKHNMSLDEFDQVVFEDLNKELLERLREVGYSEPEEEAGS